MMTPEQRARMRARMLSADAANSSDERLPGEFADGAAPKLALAMLDDLNVLWKAAVLLREAYDRGYLKSKVTGDDSDLEAEISDMLKRLWMAS